MKRLLLVPAALLAAGCSADVAPPTANLTPTASVSSAVAAMPASRDYVVTLRAGVSPRAYLASNLRLSMTDSVSYVYDAVLNGFAATLNDSAVARLARDPNVLTVERDVALRVTGGAGTQSAPIWGLDRIDQTARPLDQSYSYPNDGAGVTVYIPDTGLNYGHVDFGGRAVPGPDYVTTGGGSVDCTGHGTHVAGVIGGTKYGVAKGVKLVGIRVMDCNGNGNMSRLVASLDWILKQKQATPSIRAVVDLSLGGAAHTPTDNAIARLTAGGIVVVASAGTDTVDACTLSPGRAPSAITVTPTNINDQFVPGANGGRCVDLAAPGWNIISTDYKSPTATKNMGGGSVAAPHVAGAAALYLAAYPTATPAQVATALVANATPNVLTNAPANTVNKLLNISFIAGTPPTNQAPTVTITAPTAGGTAVQGTAVTFGGTASDPEDGALSGGSLVWRSSLNGQIGTGTSFSTTALSVGAHTITLTATDSKGATSTASRSFTITAAPATNQPPVAKFTVANCKAAYHRCEFNASSSTDDQGVVSYAWSFTGGGQTDAPTRPVVDVAWTAAGSYQATLTVTDAQGLTSTLTKTVTIP